MTTTASDPSARDAPPDLARGDPPTAEAMTLDHAPYSPFRDPHQARAPGMWALDPATWLERDAAFNAQMAYRDRLIAEARADPAAETTLATTPGAEAATAELSAALIAHLAEHPGAAGLAGANPAAADPLRADLLAADLLAADRPGLTADAYSFGEADIRRPDGVRLDRRDPPLSLIGRLAQEDFCLLAKAPGAAEYVLIAAALCFPSRWRLEEKIGRPLIAIHAPVPGYAETLGARVARLFDALRPERPLQRANWSVHGGPELRLRAESGPEETRGPFYLRVERQTLRRLPETGAVVFGIKTYVTPVERLEPAARSDLADALAGLSAEMADYKGWEARSPAVIRALRGGETSGPGGGA